MTESQDKAFQVTPEVGKWSHFFQVSVCIQLKSPVISIVKSETDKSRKKVAENMDMLVGAAEIAPDGETFVASDLFSGVVLMPDSTGTMIKITRPEVAQGSIDYIVETIVDPSELRAVSVVYAPASAAPSKPLIKIASR